MAFYLIVLVTVLTQISYKGSKVLISLYAIELGANPCRAQPMTLASATNVLSQNFVDYVQQPVRPEPCDCAQDRLVEGSL